MVWSRKFICTRMTASRTTPICSLPARVTRVDHVCREHVIVTAESDQLPPSQPGQFLQLQCRDTLATDPSIHAWGPQTWPRLNLLDQTGPPILLRRPFSIADRADDGTANRFSVISRAIGPGTRWLDRLEAGMELNVTGPLGRGYALPDPDQTALLVGGGVGIPPLLYLARTLHERGHRDVRVLFGVQTHDLLPVRLSDDLPTNGHATPCLRLPGEASFPALVATDDGSAGFAGRVTDALRALHALEGDRWRRPVICTCGPEPMLKAVAAASRAMGSDCQVCLERFMGCGLGTCLSCVVRVHAPDQEKGWRWALSCQEGPVFERDRVLDYDG